MVKIREVMAETNFCCTTSSRQYNSNVNLLIYSSTKLLITYYELSSELMLETFATE